jgi:hypothetical protein
MFKNECLAMCRAFVFCLYFFMKAAIGRFFLFGAAEK